jgi:hypothetical protein
MYSMIPITTASSDCFTSLKSLVDSHIIHYRIHEHRCSVEQSNADDDKNDEECEKMSEIQDA